MNSFASSELLRRISLGEDSSIELKSVRFAGSKIRGPSRDDLADEIAALANTDGGVLLMGVSDGTRRIEGIPVERLDDVERFVVELCGDSLAPPLQRVRILRELLPDAEGVERAVLRVDVPRSLFVHKSPGGYKIRVGSSKKEMEPSYLARLFEQRSQTRLIRYDETPVPGLSVANLDEELSDRFFSSRGGEDRQQQLTKLAILHAEEDGSLCPTLAGMLMCSGDPRVWHPGAFIQAVAYRGNSVTAGTAYQLDAADLVGPLDQQVADAVRFVARNQKVAASKSIGRKDQPQYDLLSIFEAAVNAVAHRDYAMGTAKIRLRMFDDRLELFVPGDLTNTMSVEAMPLRQSSRYEVITSLLARLPVPADLLRLLDPEAGGAGAAGEAFMDRRGEGVPLILDRSEALSGLRPTYTRIDGSEIRLVIPAAGSEP